MFWNGERSLHKYTTHTERACVTALGAACFVINYSRSVKNTHTRTRAGVACVLLWSTALLFPEQSSQGKHTWEKDGAVERGGAWWKKHINISSHCFLQRENFSGASGLWLCFSSGTLYFFNFLFHFPPTRSRIVSERKWECGDKKSIRFLITTSVYLAWLAKTLNRKKNSCSVWRTKRSTSTLIGTGNGKKERKNKKSGSKQPTKSQCVTMCKVNLLKNSTPVLLHKQQQHTSCTLWSCRATFGGRCNQNTPIYFSSCIYLVWGAKMVFVFRAN